MNNDKQILEGDALKIGVRLALALVSRCFLVWFVFGLFVPIVLLLIQLDYSGHHSAYWILVNIIFFPETLRGKTNFQLQDLVTTFIVWGIVFSVLEAVTRQIFKNRKLPSGNKILNRAYLLVYVLIFVIVPLLPRSAGTSTGGMYSVLIFFFIIGYIGFGMMLLFSKLSKLVS